MPEDMCLLDRDHYNEFGWVGMQLHAIHNSVHNFEEPDKFLPERWLEPGAEYARSRASASKASTSGEKL